MQLLESKQNLCEADLCFSLFEFSACEVVEELSPGVEFEEEVEMLVALEAGLQASHELQVVYQLAHDLLLPQHCLQHAKMVKVVFFYLLQSVQLPI